MIYILNYQCKIISSLEVENLGAQNLNSDNSNS